jgi:hypothetical protein
MTKAELAIIASAVVAIFICMFGMIAEISRLENEINNVYSHFFIHQQLRMRSRG